MISKELIEKLFFSAIFVSLPLPLIWILINHHLWLSVLKKITTFLFF